MNGALDMTFVLAFLNLLNYYILEVSLPLRIICIIFYLYFAIRILNYVDGFIYVDEAHKEKNVLESKDMASIPTNETECPLPANGYGYGEKFVPLIAQWCNKKGFCRDSQTIKDAANEIGASYTYIFHSTIVFL